MEDEAQNSRLTAAIIQVYLALTQVRNVPPHGQAIGYKVNLSRPIALVLETSQEKTEWHGYIEDRASEQNDNRRAELGQPGVVRTCPLPCHQEEA